MFLRVFVFSFVLFVGLAQAQTQALVELLRGQANKTQIPRVSLVQPDLSIAQAYAVQKAYLEQRLPTQAPIGFKAGLTNPVVQKQFGVKQPVTGVLFAANAFNETDKIRLTAFKTLMLEMELGFEIGQAITKPLPNQAALKKHIKAIAPVIELPETGFAGKPTAVDIIAANVGVAGFIKAKTVTHHFESLDLNAISATLTQAGQILSTGQGRAAGGDQWQTALWLVNHLIEQGWSLKPGQFFITGTLGERVPAKPGHYQADFGQLGHITFSILP